MKNRALFQRKNKAMNKKAISLGYKNSIEAVSYGHDKTLKKIFDETK